MIEELVKYWEEYKNQTPMIDTGDHQFRSKPSTEEFMDYLSDNFKKDDL